MRYALAVLLIALASIVLNEGLHGDAVHEVVGRLRLPHMILADSEYARHKRFISEKAIAGGFVDS